MSQLSNNFSKIGKSAQEKHMDIWTARHLSSQGERPGDHRSPYQRDKARILHSAAFRRLQAKTQIMSIGQNDFYRTRLTHSLEAAQIGTALVAQLRSKVLPPAVSIGLLPDDALMESLCLAHDLGHPPYGHGGETALNHKMRDFGGFEGNGQTFRIVGKLEPYTESGGMDLCRRTLLGLLKYPVLQPEQKPAGLHKPVKAIYREDAGLLDWVLAPLSNTDRDVFQRQILSGDQPRSCYKSLDASIMELADDIAYGVHDLEDAVVTGTVSAEQWRQQLQDAELDSSDRTFLQQIGAQLFRSEHHIRKTAIGSLVNRLITAIQLSDVLPQVTEPLLRFNAVLPQAEHQILQLLKNFIYQYVIRHPELQQNEFRGQRTVQALFDAFAAEPERLLPANTRQRWQVLAAQQRGERVVCDYIAGMTDEYASRMMQRLYGGIC
jgi:dGTPase